MQFGAIGRIIHGLAPVLILPLLGSLAAAQNPKNGDYLKNIELCNGSGRTSFEVRIKGCTALIDSGQGTTTALAIAYNNRGNARTAKGTMTGPSRISTSRSSSPDNPTANQGIRQANLGPPNAITVSHWGGWPERAVVSQHAVTRPNLGTLTVPNSFHPLAV